MVSVDLPSCSGSLNSTFSLTLLFWKLCWGRRATSVKFDVNSYALSLVCLFPFLGITATSCPESFQVPGLRFVFFGDKLQVGIASYGSFPRAQALHQALCHEPPEMLCMRVCTCVHGYRNVNLYGDYKTFFPQSQDVDIPLYTQLWQGFHVFCSSSFFPASTN